MNSRRHSRIQRRAGALLPYGVCRPRSCCAMPRVVTPAEALALGTYGGTYSNVYPRLSCYHVLCCTNKTSRRKRSTTKMRSGVIREASSRNEPARPRISSEFAAIVSELLFDQSDVLIMTPLQAPKTSELASKPTAYPLKLSKLDYTVLRWIKRCRIFRRPWRRPM
ncbi:hypothetical protein EDB83DRAFT_1770332 [Lactarius deliciosus]|nr:hypothetical protein EDB83DRAFT_1770332 [Lactarius deliciosus]